MKVTGKTDKIRKMGTVEKVFAYGKCGFISTVLGEHFYFSQKSFPSGHGRLKKGNLVSFVASEKDGKPMAEAIDADSLQNVKTIMAETAEEK